MSDKPETTWKARKLRARKSRQVTVRIRVAADDWTKRMDRLLRRQMLGPAIAKATPYEFAKLNRMIGNKKCGDCPDPGPCDDTCPRGID